MRTIVGDGPSALPRGATTRARGARRRSPRFPTHRPRGAAHDRPRLPPALSLDGQKYRSKQTAAALIPVLTLSVLYYIGASTKHIINSPPSSSLSL